MFAESPPPTSETPKDAQTGRPKKPARVGSLALFFRKVSDWVWEWRVYLLTPQRGAELSWLPPFISAIKQSLILHLRLKTQVATDDSFAKSSNKLVDIYIYIF